MSETSSPREPDPALAAPTDAAAPPAGESVPSEPPAVVEPIRLSRLSRRQAPWIVVEVDDSPATHRSLVWALREAARREATVVAVAVLDSPDGDPFGAVDRGGLRGQLAVHDRLEAQVLRAIAETGVQGRSRAAVLARPVLDALTAASRGADLVFVGVSGKTLLRQAVPRPPTRRLARGA
jgi:nucleotide-binding universal stress UspA family protein